MTWLLPLVHAAPPAATVAPHGMVVAVSPPAVDVGVGILKRGGNAVDAAVAVALAMAVTYPAAGNIGGGGFMLVHPGAGKPPTVFEYRETAPAAATVTLFAGDRSEEQWYTHKAVGVPGTVRGLALAHAKFGKLPWRDVVAPAVQLARDGFTLDFNLANSLNSVTYGESDFPELQRVFGKSHAKESWVEGDLFRQPDLARTLTLIQERGPNGFYAGTVADLIVNEMQSGHGLITAADLAGYRAKERAPIHGTYRGYDVYGPPPPSSGGTTLVLMLNILENFDLPKMQRYDPATIHLLAETMRRAYLDRARHLGDPDFTTIPTHLTDKAYAKQLAASIDVKKATPSAALAPELKLTDGGQDTTHFSVIDRDGMAVANTYTLERSYGSKIVVKGAGFILNNEMIDFNPKPGVTDRSGRIGTAANLIAPGKRMLSSQTPTIVAKDGKVRLVTGSPGSRTIINTSLQIVLNVLDFGMDVQAAVDAPRIHHAWFPDELRLEGQSKLAEELRGYGHKVVGTRQGDAHTIWVDPITGLFHGAADKRINGKASGY